MRADSHSILLDDQMRIKVTDFGSAKILSKDHKDVSEVEALGLSSCLLVLSS